MTSPFTRFLNYLEIHKATTVNQFETRLLLGKPYTVIKGTLRTQADYDDAWLFALAQEARVVFDIGSNIGQAAILLLHTGTVQEIVLVDPSQAALARAAQNLITNGLSGRARFVCAFASAKPDERVDFYSLLGGAASSMYSSHAVSASEAGNKVKVSTTTIDNLVAAYRLKPDLVKIDTEGAERLVLQGASELAKQQSTRFFVEMHSNPELSMRENTQAILEWCADVDYQAWYMKEKTRIDTADAIAGRGRCHLLLLPINQDFPSRLNKIDQGDPVGKDIL